MDDAAQRWLEREETREEIIAEILHYLVPVVEEEIKHAVGQHERSYHLSPPIGRRLYAMRPITDSQLLAWPDPARQRLRDLQAQRVKRLDPLESVEESPDDAAWKMDHPEAN
jgi:hypothetical protein